MLMVMPPRLWPPREGLRAIIGDAICVFTNSFTAMSHDYVYPSKSRLGGVCPLAGGAFAIGGVALQAIGLLRARDRRQHDRPNRTFDAGAVMEGRIR